MSGVIRKKNTGEAWETVEDTGSGTAPGLGDVLAVSGDANAHSIINLHQIFSVNQDPGSDAIIVAWTDGSMAGGNDAGGFIVACSGGDVLKIPGEPTPKLGVFGANPVAQPVVPQTIPGVQDVIDALVALGLVAQHD